MHDDLEGQVVGDRYRLKGRIGRGGMSLVYLAEQIGVGTPLAIKFLRSAFVNLPGFVRRFEQEALACRRLDHENCVRLHDFGVAFGSPYLAMEYVDGRTLTTVIAEGTVEPRRAIRIASQILSGLGHAHGRGVVHRDLKPGNVMLARQTEGDAPVKILDFGTAQILTGEPGGAGDSGTDVGTPWYMAPEQAAGHPTDPRTDLYALGVMLFELLTRERPFVADEPMRVLQLHLSSPIPSLRVLRPDLGVSAELEAVIVRAMQKQPGDRFADAAAFAGALQGVPEVSRLHRGDGAARPRRVTQSVVRPPSAAMALGAEPAPRRQLPWAWIGAAAALVLAGALLLTLWLAGAF